MLYISGFKVFCGCWTPKSFGVSRYKFDGTFELGDKKTQDQASLV